MITLVVYLTEFDKESVRSCVARLQDKIKIGSLYGEAYPPCSTLPLPNFMNVNSRTISHRITSMSFFEHPSGERWGVAVGIKPSGVYSAHFIPWVLNQKHPCKPCVRMVVGPKRRKPMVA